MKNCLVKTYMAACDDNSLPIIDEMIVKWTPSKANEKWMNASINSSNYSMFTVIEGSVGISLSSNAHFEDFYGNNLGTDVVLEPNGVAGEVISEDTNEVTITFKHFYNMYNNGRITTASFPLEAGKNNRIQSLVYTQITLFGLIGDVELLKYVVGKQVDVSNASGNVKDIPDGSLLVCRNQGPSKYSLVGDLKYVIPNLGLYIEGKTEIDGLDIFPRHSIGGDASLLPRKLFYWTGSNNTGSNPNRQYAVYTWTLGGRTGADAWIMCCSGSATGSNFTLKSDEDVNNMLIDQSGCTFDADKASTHDGDGSKIKCKTVSGSYTPSEDAIAAIATLKSKGITAVIVNGVEL